MAKRFEGKNLEEALENAAQAFNVERYRLSYHVVLEKRGFLGSMKRVVIEAAVNDSAVPPPPKPQIDDERQPDFPPPARDAFRPVAESRRGEGRGRGRRSRHDRDRPQRRESPPPRGERIPAGEREAVPEQGAESEQAARIHQWCDELFRLGELDLEARTEESDEQVTVRLFGPDSRLVLAHGGELLDSLQILANKGLSDRGVDKPIEFDCSDFKERRVDDLGRRAREVAETVRREGREQLLEAMSPVERRIVHMTLQDDSGVATESRGEGFFKRVAIVPRKEEKPSTVPS